MKVDVAVVKVGGNIIDNEASLESFLEKFAALPCKKILVHGGGKIATTIGDKLGIVSSYVDGRRVTDRETLDLVTMVYAGLVNKRIVSALQGKSCNAIGLTGADGNSIAAHKREVGDVDYGFVGDVGDNGVDATLLELFLAKGLTPVMAPVTHDGGGVLLNTNADTIALEVAKALAANACVNLVFCFEQRGVLRNVEDSDSVIRTITKESFSDMVREGVVSGGMIPKLKNALEAVDNKVNSVVIGHAEDLFDLINAGAGTVIK